MTREQAAVLLGVDADADVTAVRQAWRMWARLAHPDAGGDRAHFEELARARDVLLRETDVDLAFDPMLQDASFVTTPRPALRHVVRRPGGIGLLAVVGAVTLLAAGVLIAAHLPHTIAALALGVAAASVCLTIERAWLDARADTGHRIVLLAVTWVPVGVVTFLAASRLGADLLTVLPVFVVPFVVTVALVNPGAGLWRPVRAAS